jgi:hypothetical protein
MEKPPVGRLFCCANFLWRTFLFVNCCNRSIRVHEKLSLWLEAVG